MRVALVGPGAGEGAAARVATALGAAWWEYAAPAGDDDDGPRDLGDFAAVYVAGADDPDLFVRARRSGNLVVSARAVETLVGSCIPADVVLVDGGDPAHDVDETELPVAPGAIVTAQGPAGGWLRRADGTEERWGDGGAAGAPALGAQVADGIGAAIAVVLGRGEGLEDALRLAASVGAALARSGTGSTDPLAALGV
ncbi:MAG: hypothetical protein RIG88_07940 [Roseitalea porphyridii]